MKHALIALALGLLLLAPGQTRAEVATLKTGMTLDLPEFGTLCRVDKNGSEVDRRLFDRFARLNDGVMELLAIHVDCETLVAMRAGQSSKLSSYAIIGATTQNGEPITFGPDTSRAELLDGVAASMGQGLFEDGMAEGMDILREKLQTKGQVPTTARSLGMLDRDDNAVYTGMITRNTAGDGERSLASVGAITVIKGVAMNIGSYRPLRGQETFSAILKEIREETAELIAANEG